MNHGWVKLHRELLDKSIWTNSTVEQRLLLVQLLLLVTHKPVEYDIYGDKRMLQPGQLLMSLRKLAAECDLSYQVVRTGIDRFEKLGFLTQQVTQRGTLISIVNWGKYQGSDDEANATSNARLTQY